MTSPADQNWLKAVTAAGAYAEEHFEAEQEFVPGETPIPVSGKVIGVTEIAGAVMAVLDGWLTEGHWVTKFERQLAEAVGVRWASMVNSGSSANLIALSALTSQRLKRYRLSPGDGVITTACGFPTTINPIIQTGMVPVFVDVELGTYVPSAETIEATIKSVPGVKAIFAAHTLGNPLPIREIAELCERHGLIFIEDNCDALGSEYEGKRTGSFGEISTASFYPAHHITTGEGGAVFTKSSILRRIIESFRDWGRDCWCEPGKDNTCGKRFDWTLGDLPEGYDHKYIYSEIGYNLKSTDLQAAIGQAQIMRLPSFIKKRRANFALLKFALSDLDEFFILPEPTPDSEPAWFGFPITIRESAPFTRRELAEFLTFFHIGNRTLFGGNILRQPAYARTKYAVGPLGLPNSDVVAERTLWIGTFPGISNRMIQFMDETVHGFVDKTRQKGSQTA